MLAEHSLVFPQILECEDDLRCAPRGESLGSTPDRARRHVSGVKAVLLKGLIGVRSAVQVTDLWARRHKSRLVTKAVQRLRDGGHEGSRQDPNVDDLPKLSRYD